MHNGLSSPNYRDALENKKRGKTLVRGPSWLLLLVGLLILSVLTQYTRRECTHPSFTFRNGFSFQGGYFSGDVRFSARSSQGFSHLC